MIRVKVCGLDTPEAMSAAAETGAVGCIIEIEGRHRSISRAQAAGLFSHAGVFQVRVSVTDRTDPQELWELLDDTHCDLLQVHAYLSKTEWEQLLKEMGHNIVPVLFALPDGSYMDISTPAVVLEGGDGGTGTVGDWDQAAAWAAAHPRTQVILAGGLTPANVAAAITKVRPYAVDVSSGVEVDGHKDPALVSAFIETAQGALGTTSPGQGGTGDPDQRGTIPETSA